MNQVVSKVAIHCQGPARNGYGDFLKKINAAGRRLPFVKVRDDFGAVDEALGLWPDMSTIGAVTEWDGADYNVDLAFDRITTASLNNPKIKYWEYFNERNGDYAQQADLSVDLMTRLKPLGIGLCIFNCASGTPPYPDEDGGEAYEQIARACKFAIENQCKVILGLHEYESSGGTIGRFKPLADYLESHGALIPIAITEYGFETHPGDTKFMSAIKANDPIYMADDRVLGCAAFTLGGGGWSGSNYQTALPALGDYVASVPPFTPPPPPVVTTHFVVDTTDSITAQTVRSFLEPLNAAGEFTKYGEWQS